MIELIAGGLMMWQIEYGVRFADGSGGGGGPGVGQFATLEECKGEVSKMFDKNQNMTMARCVLWQDGKRVEEHSFGRGLIIIKEES